MNDCQLANFPLPNIKFNIILKIPCNSLPAETQVIFKSEYCLVETYDGSSYPIHGSIKEWEKQYEKWHNINRDIYHELNIELSKIISKK